MIFTQKVFPFPLQHYTVTALNHFLQLAGILWNLNPLTPCACMVSPQFFLM